MRTGLIAITLFVVPAFAQVAEFGVHGGVSKINNKDIGSIAGQTGAATTVSLDDGWRFGFRVTLNNWRFAGHEFGYGYNRSKLLIGNQSQGGMAIHQGFYDFLLYATPDGSRVRPFVAGGGQFSNFVQPGASATQGSGENKIGFNYGGGIKFLVHGPYMIRLDYRDYVSGKPYGDFLVSSGGRLRQTEISVGVSYTMQ